jgi:hypothetical protein
MKGVYIVRLFLSDSKGGILSRNDYLMRGQGTENFFAVSELGKASLKARRLAPSKDGKLRFEVSNNSKVAAMNLKFNLCCPQTGEIILPAYFSDGYFHLLPGEKRVIEMHSPSCGNIVVEGYNVDSQIIIK